MVDERASPSAGWREVYEEMGVEDGVEGDREDGAESVRCSDCGLMVEREEHRCPMAGVGDGEEHCWSRK